ncbi:MAG: hypothetical protein AAF708_06275 [Deinococcota bacterium]
MPLYLKYRSCTFSTEDKKTGKGTSSVMGVSTFLMTSTRVPQMLEQLGFYIN